MLVYFCDHIYFRHISYKLGNEFAKTGDSHKMLFSLSFTRIFFSHIAMNSHYLVAVHAARLSRYILLDLTFTLPPLSVCVTIGFK